MINYFDCNTMLGRYYNAAFGNFLTPSLLEERYDVLGVGEGVVYHAKARDHSPLIGNKQLISEIKGHPRLHPAWVVVPHHTAEMEPPQDLFKNLKSNGVRIVRIFCGNWYYTSTFDLLIYGEIFEMLEHYKVPLILEVDIAEFDSSGLILHIWRDLYSMLKSFPLLRLILTLPKLGGFDRYLFPLMEKYEYLTIETSGYQLFGGYEIITKSFGAKRLLFGSRAPYMDIATGMITLQYAEIDPQDRALIAGGNLRRLLKEVSL